MVPELVISYKPQKISPKFDGSVRSLLTKKIQDTWLHPQFKTDVTNPLIIEPLLDRDVQSLSGGELQRVALCLALGTPANLYLIDEPSAYLDSEQRLHAAKVIKRFFFLFPPPSLLLFFFYVCLSVFLVVDIANFFLYWSSLF